MVLEVAQVWSSLLTLTQRGILKVLRGYSSSHLSSKKNASSGSGAVAGVSALIAENRI